MVIQDVNNPTLNITAEIPVHEIDAFREHCKRYYVFLKEEIQQNSRQVQQFDFVVKNLDQAIEVDCNWWRKISNKAAEFKEREPERMEYEQQILTLLTRLSKVYAKNVQLTPIGSSEYGIGGSDTDFNIGVSSGMYENIYLKLEFLSFRQLIQTVFLITSNTHFLSKMWLPKISCNIYILQMHVRKSLVGFYTEDSTRSQASGYRWYILNRI